MTAKVTGKAAIITGASDGIGRGLALEFARRGYSLGIIARREALLREVAAECKQAGAPRVETLALDVTEIDRFLAGLRQLAETLDCEFYVANAGIGDVIPATADGTGQAVRMCDLNVKAAIVGLEFMKQRFASRRSGCLVGVSSIAGYRGLPEAGVYSATKAALRVYLEALRADLSPYGVNVVTVTPGFVATAPNLARSEPQPFRISVEQACSTIIKGIVRRKKYITAPWQFKIAAFFLKYTPSFVYDGIMSLAMSFKS